MALIKSRTLSSSIAHAILRSIRARRDFNFTSPNYAKACRIDESIQYQCTVNDPDGVSYYLVDNGGLANLRIDRKTGVLFGGNINASPIIYRIKVVASKGLMEKNFVITWSKFT